MFAAKDSQLTRPSGGAYIIARSLRFRSSATAYLNRTFGTATSRKTWTLSAWCKRSKQGAVDNAVFTGYINGAQTGGVYFSDDTVTDALEFRGQYIAGWTGVLVTSSVYRDPSAWYHIVAVLDTTQAQTSSTAADSRMRLYINGVQLTAFNTATMPAQNSDGSINQAQAHWVGALSGTAYYFDGYMTDVNFVDGQALAPTSFGAINATTGVWAPIKYTGTYGTNGFHLDFNSYATTAALGTDTSGNGNTWTVNNFSVTAGATYDSMIDVPTVGTTGSNYSTLNPLHIGTGSSLSSGNLNFASTSGGGSIQQAQITGTFGLPQSGKWYFECTPTTLGASIYIGVVASTHPMATSPFSGSPIRAYESTGDKSTGGTDSAYGNTYTTNDVIGVAVNMDAGEIVFYKNNTAQNSGTPAFTDLAGTTWLPYTVPGSSGVTNNGNFNFGQRGFTYTPPTGYSALNTYNLPAPSILIGAAHMAATTYTGTGASLTVANTVNNSSFQPDFVWMKSRSAATDHALYDSVRGTTKDLVSNSTAAETTQATGLTAFGSTGFTVGALAKVNTSAATYIGWQWKGSGTTVSNTTGTITSTVCVNPTAGFSVLTYTGTGVAATIGHSLGVAPSLIIVKPRSTTGDWISYTAPTGAGNFLLLNTTAASAASSTKWNNTTPTSSVFSVGVDLTTNTLTTTYVAYCFAPIAGYSAFGSYTGNGSTDGPFVFTGFRPRWVLFKSSSSVNNWQIYDTSRNTSNATTNWIYPDVANAEATSGVDIDILSNGFKPRSTNAINNGSGVTYIYAAFAESPFKNSLAR